MGENNENPYNHQIIGMHNNKEFQHSCNKKRNNLKEKETRMHTIHKNCELVATKHLKRFSTPLTIREMKIRNQ